MDFADRIAQQVAKLPPELKQIADLQLQAGNEFVDVEVSADTTVLVMNHPFRVPIKTLPPGIQYRELKERDPMFFQFSTDDGKWLLMTVKFKPMVFEKITGPPDPTPAHIERMKVIAEKEEAAAKARAENKIPFVPPSLDPSLGAAGQKFLSSMTMTFDMWHDGLGYDLDALKQVPPSELRSIESILIKHTPRDWRDIEALARIDSPRAQDEVKAAVKHPNPTIRREAMNYYPESIEPKDREKLLLHALQSAAAYDGLTEALDEVEQFHPPSVIDMLLKKTLSGGENAVHFAAMLYFLHGKSKEAFDWDHRPFFLRFNTTDRNEIKQAFKELCNTIGVDVAKYVRP